MKERKKKERRFSDLMEMVTILIIADRAVKKFVNLCAM